MKELQRIFEFGKGRLVVDQGLYDGKPAIFICSAKSPGNVGDSAEREDTPTNTLQPGEIVLVFPTDKQADLVVKALFSFSLKN